MESERPVRAQDDSFVHHLIVHNLVDIVEEAGFNELSNELRRGEFCIRHLKQDSGPNWEEYINNQLDESGTGRHFYTIVILTTNKQVSGYFTTESAGFAIDPWETQKIKLVSESMVKFQNDYENVSEPTLHTLLLYSLFSNSASFQSANIDEQESQLLINDILPAVNYIESTGQGRIVILLGNSGVELCNDLRLALRLSANYPVELHVSPYPCFVYSPTGKDVRSYVNRLPSKLRAELRQNIESGMIKIVEDEFYSSPLELAEMPDRLKASFMDAYLIILKGDHAYRRMLGDRKFSSSLHFPDVVSRFTNSPVLALRLLKSPLVVGLAIGDWYLEGTYGLAQFSLCQPELNVENITEEVNEHNIESQTSDTEAPTNDEGRDKYIEGQVQFSDELSLVLEPTDSTAMALAQVDETHSETVDAASETIAPDQMNLSVVSEHKDEVMVDKGIVVEKQDIEQTVANQSKLDVASSIDSSESTWTISHATKNNASIELSESNGKGNKRSHEESTSADIEAPKVARTQNDESDDGLQDADDLPWTTASENEGMEMEEIGRRKDPSRPFIKATLPKRAYTAYEYYCHSKPHESHARLSQIWSAMTKTQRARFELAAQKDKTRYEAELIERAREVALLLKSDKTNNS